jgi:hypothetical protein
VSVGRSLDDLLEVCDVEREGVETEEEMDVLREWDGLGKLGVVWEEGRPFPSLNDSNCI